MVETNETHDPGLGSWVESANAVDTDFPIQNLPFGIFRRRESPEAFRGGVAIGDQVLDLAAARAAGLFDGVAAQAAAACAGPTLDPLMALGPDRWSALRLALSRLLRTSADRAGDAAAALVPAETVEMGLPGSVGDFTDFYTSIEHATNGGRLGGREPPLYPNFRHLPVAYHGRASSVRPSGTPCRRPHGQSLPAGASGPRFGPVARLDYEAEIGAWVGIGNRLGEPVPLAEAERHLFGLCLLNDWSSRDVQAWEMAPLGPFLSKSLLTSVSPWVVTLEALAPFRVPSRPRGVDEPAPLPYLDDPADRSHGGVDIAVEVLLQSARMREQGAAPMRVSRGRFAGNYWTLFQMLAHHTSNGCNLRTGDLYGSGTISGPTDGERGCLLEFTERGTRPFDLTGGERRTFLEDGDEVIFRGRCERDGFAGIGFGKCRGVVMPAA